jgi:acyl carrier protein
VFAPLVCGARLAIGGGELGRDVAGLARFLADERVTISVGLIQPLLQALVASPAFDGLGALRHVVQGGEALQPATRDEFVRRSRAVLHNAYGATEIAIDGTCASFGPADLGQPVSIGREVAGLCVYVLDDRLRPVPAGVTGEIYFAGAKLARGYWDRPALTAEAFLPDPFTGRPGERMYRTGDLARRRADGELEFLGRRDDQVKIRGFRVELGDIEATLAQHPGVHQVRVIKTGAEQLAAYAVAAPGCTPDALREFVRERLPPYMVPAGVHLLDALPTLPSGKLDVRALPQHPVAPSGAAPAAALTAAEQRLAALWKDQLGIADIAAHDDFFELGGHSLLLISLQAGIQDAFGRDVPITQLIAAPSLRAMAALVVEPEAAAAAAAEPEPERDAAELVAGAARRDAMQGRRRRAEAVGDLESDDDRS